MLFIPKLIICSQLLNNISIIIDYNQYYILRFFPFLTNVSIAITLKMQS